MSRYILFLKNIPQGEFSESYQLDKSFFEDYNGFDIFGGTVLVTLSGNRVGDVYHILFTLNGVVETVCSRCNDPLSLPLNGQYHLVVKFGETFETDFDEEVVVPRAAPVLDLDHYFYEFIVLAKPIQCLHKKGECAVAVEEFFDRQSRIEAGDKQNENSPFASLLDNPEFQ